MAVQCPYHWVANVTLFSDISLISPVVCNTGCETHPSNLVCSFNWTGVLEVICCGDLNVWVLTLLVVLTEEDISVPVETGGLN